MWLLGIIACAILAAVLLIITFAHIEAGMGTGNKWLASTVCVLALLIGLLVYKPRPEIEYVDYMPEPPPVLEEMEKPAGAGQISGTAGQSGTTGWSSLEQTRPPRETSTAGRDDDGGDVEETEDAAAEEYFDPILEEILALKREAEESAANRRSDPYSSDLWARINPDGDETKQLVDSGPENGRDVEGADEQNPGDQGTEFDDDGRAPGGSEADEQGVEADADDPAADTGGGSEEPADRERQTETAIVTASSLNVRDRGSIEGRVIDLLSKGTEVEVISDPESGDWLQVRLESGQTGWVMKKYLDLAS